MSASTNITPKIYVADLAAYNAGILHGTWINCNQDKDEIFEEIFEMLKDSPEPIAEEWAIHDYEGFGSLPVSEFHDIEKLAETAMLLEEYGPLALEVMAYLGGDLDAQETRRIIDEQYQGEYRSISDWAESFLEETGQLENIPDNLRYYFDYDSFARDCELNGDIFTIAENGELHVFWAH